MSKIPKEGERRYEMLEKVSMGQALKSIPASGQGGNGPLGETFVKDRPSTAAIQMKLSQECGQVVLSD